MPPLRFEYGLGHFAWTTSISGETVNQKTDQTNRPFAEFAQKPMSTIASLRRSVPVSLILKHVVPIGHAEVLLDTATSVSLAPELRKSLKPPQGSVQ